MCHGAATARPMSTAKISARALNALDQTAKAKTATRSGPAAAPLARMASPEKIPKPINDLRVTAAAAARQQANMGKSVIRRRAIKMKKKEI